MNMFSSIWNYKCPRCRKGDLYIKPFNVKEPVKMPERCEVCGQKTMPEPGFYYGAMFISYILTGWIALIIVGGCMYFLDFSVNQAFLVLIVVAILSYFFVLRLSRSVWIHIAVKYDKDWDKELDKK